MKMILKVIFSFVLFVITALYTGCATDMNNPASPVKQNPTTMVAGFPEGYQDWSNTFSKVVLDKTSPFYGFQRVLVNDIALSAYKNGGQYPEGSRLVLEFNEPALEGPERNDIVKDKTNWVAMMTKDSKAIQTGGWVYEAYDGESKVMGDVDVVSGCYHCHTAMKHKDYIFSSPG